MIVLPTVQPPPVPGRILRGSLVPSALDEGEALTHELDSRVWIAVADAAPESSDCGVRPAEMTYLQRLI